MIVFDTTVLVYAVGEEHPLREPCRALVAAVRDGALQATTTPEVLQEFAHVRARRRPRSDAAELANAYLRLLRPLMVVDEEDLRDGLSLLTRVERLGAFDVVLAAAALRRGARALVSADSGFAAVEGLGHRDPREPDLPAELSRR